MRKKTSIYLQVEDCSQVRFTPPPKKQGVNKTQRPACDMSRYQISGMQDSQITSQLPQTGSEKCPVVCLLPDHWLTTDLHRRWQCSSCTSPLTHQGGSRYLPNTGPHSPTGIPDALPWALLACTSRRGERDPSLARDSPGLS